MAITNFAQKMGFTSEAKITAYFKATDILDVNWEKIKKYNARIIDIFFNLNAIITDEFKLDEEQFHELEMQLDSAYKVLRKFQIVERKFHNNGRAPESMYFAWMRGYMAAAYFKRIIAKVFSVDVGQIKQFGKDNLDEVASAKGRTKTERIVNGIAKFKKEPDADFEIPGRNVLIEVQAGFTGKNDIKKSKADAAKLNAGKTTYVFHFDLFNGKLAVVDITRAAETVPENKWENNDRYEAVKTTPIPAESFKWSMDDEFPDVESIITTL